VIRCGVLSGEKDRKSVQISEFGELLTRFGGGLERPWCDICYRPGKLTGYEAGLAGEAGVADAREAGRGNFMWRGLDALSLFFRKA
jgi:hypothetical protein